MLKLNCFFFLQAPIASWRGTRDPTLSVPVKPVNPIDESEKPTKRDEFAGFGGMKRIR